jgi:hypothetical protein
MSYPIPHFIAKPYTLKDYPRTEWVAILQEALEEHPEDTFKKLLRAISSAHPWYIGMLSKMHPWSVWPFKELFEKESKDPKPSVRKFSELSLLHFFSEINHWADSGWLIDPLNRKKLFEKAYNFLSAEEYNFFLQVMAQDLPAPLRDKIWELVISADYAHSAYKDFFKAEDFSEFYENGMKTFENSKNEEIVFPFSDPLRFYGRCGSLVYELDIKTHEKGKPLENPRDKVLLDVSGFYSSSDKKWHPVHNHVFVFSGTEFLGILDDVSKSFFLSEKMNRRVSNTAEHVFYAKMASGGISGALFLKRVRGEDFLKVKTLIGEDEIKHETLTLIADFEVIPFILFNGKYGIIKGLSADGQEFVFGETEDLKAIPGTQREFKVTTINGTFKVIEKD